MKRATVPHLQIRLSLHLVYWLGLVLMAIGLSHTASTLMSPTHLY